MAHGRLEYLVSDFDLSIFLFWYGLLPIVLSGHFIVVLFVLSALARLGTPDFQPARHLAGRVAAGANLVQLLFKLST